MTNQADAFSSFSHATYGCGIEYVRIYDVSMGNSRFCHPLPIQHTSRHQGTRSSCAERPGCRCWVLLPRGIFPLACCKFGLLNLKVAIHLSIPHKCKHANDLVDLSLVSETMFCVLSIYRDVLLRLLVLPLSNGSPVCPRCLDQLQFCRLPS